MRPLKRKFVNKKHSAKRFKRNAGRTKGANMRPQAMRGGYRL
jgi:hypothetical protein